MFHLSAPSRRTIHVDMDDLCGLALGRCSDADPTIPFTNYTANPLPCVLPRKAEKTIS